MKSQLIRCLFLFSALMPGWLTPAGRYLEASQSEDSRFEVRFKLYRDYMIVVEGSIGRLQKRNLLIDTGAVPSVLDLRLARKLKLKGTPQQMSVFNGAVKVENAIIPRLELGPIELELLPVVVRDLTFIQRHTGIRIDALIGLDVLGWSNLAIDYKAKKLVFGARLPAGPKLAFELGPGCMLLPVQIGARKLRLMLDTGARDLMLFESSFRDHFPKLRATGRQRAANMAGVAELKQVQLPHMEIGATSFGRSWAVVIPSENDSPGTRDFDGLIGLTVLCVSRVYFDFEKQLVSWVH